MPKCETNLAVEFWTISYQKGSPAATEEPAFYDLGGLIVRSLSTIIRFIVIDDLHWSVSC